jgi:hypothetical protein
MAVGGRARARLGDRLGAAGAAAALGVVLTGGFAACTPAPAGGGDLQVTFGGGNVGAPSGEVWADVENVGTEALEGRTTVTAAVASGPLRFTHAAWFSGDGPGDDGGVTAVGPEISADGKQLTFHLDGPQVPADDGQVRVYFTDNLFTQPSTYTITFSHPDDANAANDSFTIPRPPAP